MSPADTTMEFLGPEWRTAIEAALAEMPAGIPPGSLGVCVRSDDRNSAFTIRIDGAATVEEGLDEEADVEVEVDYETAVGLFSQQEKWEEAFNRGALEVAGDLALAIDVVVGIESPSVATQLERLSRTVRY